MLLKIIYEIFFLGTYWILFEEIKIVANLHIWKCKNFLIYCVSK